MSIMSILCSTLICVFGALNINSGNINNVKCHIYIYIKYTSFFVRVCIFSSAPNAYFLTHTKLAHTIKLNDIDIDMTKAFLTHSLPDGSYRRYTIYIHQRAIHIKITYSALMVTL